MSKDARIILSIFLLLISAGMGSAAEDDLMTVDESGVTLVNESALAASLGNIPTATLSEQEKEGLLYMAEEEKLAGDVYASLYQRWNAPVFRNIGDAERTHEAAVASLLQRYGLPDPTIDAGSFSNVTLQRLYDDLVNRGSSSLQESLMVGAAIEELDIQDLKKRIEETDKPDITVVYENLMRGSENHLRAFVRQLRGMGIEYQPQYLSAEEYRSII